MKILLVNAFESIGGAGRASQRLYRGLLTLGINITFLVTRPDSESSQAIPLWRTKNPWLPIILSRIDLLPLLFYPKKKNNIFSPSIIPTFLNATIKKSTPEIIHLQWINYAMVQIEQIAKIKSPIVWTLHDSWAFTGGCHLPFDCTNYENVCGTCPELGSQNPNDLSHDIWLRKNTAYKNLNIHVVCPSHWLAKRARASSLFQGKTIHIIPNGIDTKIYKPANMETSRTNLNLPQNKKLIFIGAMHIDKDQNKGFHLLRPILDKMNAQGMNDIEFIIIGSKKKGREIIGAYPFNFLGILKNENTIAAAYTAANVTLLLSRQENLPYTLIESLACGTPAVAFNVGGIPEIIDHLKNGYCAEPYDINDILKGLLWVFNTHGHHHELSNAARKKCTEVFSIESQLQSYINLYKEIL
ncbi:MAG: glycosyltransferase [Candidatus Omnitrophica bacterium]|nr:glycosyltransferase [Candidatus Omnitrophota bacterium]